MGEFIERYASLHDGYFEVYSTFVNPDNFSVGDSVVYDDSGKVGTITALWEEEDGTYRVIVRTAEGATLENPSVLELSEEEYIAPEEETPPADEESGTSTDPEWWTPRYDYARNYALSTGEFTTEQIDSWSKELWDVYISNKTDLEIGIEDMEQGEAPPEEVEPRWVPFSYEDTDWEAIAEKVIEQHAEKLKELVEQKNAGEITEEEYDAAVEEMVYRGGEPAESTTPADLEGYYYDLEAGGYVPYPKPTLEEFEEYILSGDYQAPHDMQYDLQSHSWIDANGFMYDYLGTPLGYTYDQYMGENGYYYDPNYGTYVPYPEQATYGARGPSAPYDSGYAPPMFQGGGGGGFEEEMAAETRPRIVIKDGKYCIVVGTEEIECFKTKEEAIKKLRTLGS